MTIRPETPYDIAAIEKVHVAAFEHHPRSRQTEHLIVNALRAAGALTVSLVAEVDGEVSGHIAFSPIRIDGRPCSWFILGPVGVLPRCQRRGIGCRLVLEGLQAIRGLGAEGCVLVGNPAYYSRFGFAPDPGLVFEGVPAENFLCLTMSGRVPRGRVSHHPAFSAAPGT
jgi:putative acetyltransferase